MIAGYSLLRRSVSTDTITVFAASPALTTSALPSSAAAPVVTVSSVAFQFRAIPPGNQEPGTAMARYAASATMNDAMRVAPATVASRSDGSDSAASALLATAAVSVAGVARTESPLNGSCGS